jgi:hypothetical protein
MLEKGDYYNPSLQRMQTEYINANLQGNWRPIRVRLFFVSIIVFIAISTAARAAEQYPTSALLKNTVENSALTIQCEKQSDGSLKCNFLQVSVRKEAKASDLKPYLKKNMDRFLKESLKKANEEGGNKLCSQLSEYLTAIKSGIAPKNWPNFDAAKFQKMLDPANARATNESFKYMEALRDAVCEPSKVSVEKALRLGHNKEVKTCRVSSHQFEQLFRFEAESGNWVHTSTPSGACGKIQIGVLSEYWPFGKTSIAAWKYVTKKVVTNKNGKDGLFGSCSNWDEEEYTYDIDTQERFLECDYIKFSVF